MLKVVVEFTKVPDHEPCLDFPSSRDSADCLLADVPTNLAGMRIVVRAKKVEVESKGLNRAEIQVEHRCVPFSCDYGCQGRISQLIQDKVGCSEH